MKKYAIIFILVNFSIICYGQIDTFDPYAYGRKSIHKLPITSDSIINEIKKGNHIDKQLEYFEKKIRNNNLSGLEFFYITQALFNAKDKTGYKFILDHYQNFPSIRNVDLPWKRQEYSIYRIIDTIKRETFKEFTDYVFFSDYLDSKRSSTDLLYVKGWIPRFEDYSILYNKHYMQLSKRKDKYLDLIFNQSLDSLINVNK